MKYLIHNHGEGAIINIKICDTHKLAQEYVDKIGYGYIEPIDDNINLEKRFYYSGHAICNDLEIMTKDQIDIFGHENYSKLISLHHFTYDRRGNNLYIRYNNWLADSIDDAKNKILPLILEAIEKEKCIYHE